MLSISDSDYRIACRSFILKMMKRPSMYFRSLGELEAILGGYDSAFEQMFSLSREQLFFDQFCDWILNNKGLSCAGGWALIIEVEGKKCGRNPIELFGIYVNEFFDAWLSEDACAGQV